MAGKIMIVEDEVVVSADLEAKLVHMGYEIVAVVRYGEEVLAVAGENRPDLVLMDINLKGEMDGVEAAKQVKEELGVPVIYLTAFADQKTLDRVKATTPYAYLKKPVNLTDLRISIEIGLHKAEIDRKVAESELRFRTIADWSYDCETWMGAGGTFHYVSPSCKRISGYDPEVFYDNADIFLEMVHPDDRKRMGEHITSCLVTGREPCQIEFRIVRPDGEERWIEHFCRAVYDEGGLFLGSRANNRDITERKRIEAEREALICDLQEARDNIKTLGGLIPICSSCKKIRDDQGYWNKLESYISKHSDAEFTHSICTECAKKLYPELYGDDEE